MRPMRPDEDHIDIIKKLNIYISSDDNVSVNFIDVTGDIMKDLDKLERYSNTIPDDKYKHDLLNNISMIRNYLIQCIDTINEING